MSKGGNIPLHIFITAPGLPFGAGTLDRQSLGGSETAAIELSEALARRGHFVTVFSVCERSQQRGQKPAPNPAGIHNGVAYEPIDSFLRAAQTAPFDILIISRTFEIARYVTGARQTWLWCHDLLTKQSRFSFIGGLWTLEGVLFLSEFQRRQYVELSGLDSPRFHVTRNGIDLKRIAAAPSPRPEARRQAKKEGDNLYLAAGTRACARNRPCR